VFDTSTSEIDSDASDVQVFKNKLNKNSTRVKGQQRGDKVISPDMIKAMMLYYPEAELPDLSPYNNSHVGIFIEKDYFFPQNNKNLYSNKLWGTEFYHYKSDVVLLLFHSGRVSIESLKDPKVKGFYLICHVSKRKNFKESTMNGITSKKLTGQDKDGFTLKPVQLDPLETFRARNLIFYANNIHFQTKRRINALPNFIQPHNWLSLYCIKFNRLNDLCIQYSLQNICDKSDKKEEFLSYLLEEYDLILETLTGYKLVLQFKCISTTEGASSKILYILSEVINPMSVDRDQLQRGMTEDKGRTLRVLEDDVEWSEIVWDKDRLTLRGHVFPGLDTIMFIPRPDLHIESENVNKDKT
jgi:hypothetical protein